MDSSISLLLNALTKLFSRFHLDSLDQRKQPCKKLNVFVWGTLFLVVAYGWYLRIGDQASRDFWVDEVWRAQQILHAESYNSLLNGEFFGHEAPVHFSEYIFGKLGLFIFGITEFAFRYVSLISSLVCLLLFAVLSARFFSPPVAIFGTFLFATSYGTIEHSYEAKPYSFEMLLSLFSIYLTYEVLQKRVNSWTLLTLLGLILVLSHLSPFFLFLPIIAWFFKGEEKKFGIFKKSALWFFATVCLVVSLNLLIKYHQALYLRGIVKFWADFSLVDVESLKLFLEETVPKKLHWYLFSVAPLPNYPTALSLFLLALCWIVAPILLLYKKNLLSIFLLFPLVLQIVLSVLGAYPLLMRVNAFYFPYMLLGFLVTMELSLQFLVHKVRIPNAPFWLSLLLVICISWYAFQFPQSAHPGTRRNIEQIRPLLQRIDTEEIKNAVLATNYSADLALQFYELRGVEEYRRIVLPSSKLQKTAELESEQFIRKIKVEYEPGTFIWLLATHRTLPYVYLKANLERLNIDPEVDEVFQGSFLLGFRLK